MKKKALSLFLCMAMVISFLAVSPQSAHSESDIVYSLATDNEIQNKSAGDTFEGTTWLQRAGEPTLTIGEKDGVKIISVTGRGEDWHCVDLKNLTSLPDGYEYTIKVTGTVTGATDDDKVKMKLSQTGSPYQTHDFHEVGEAGQYSLEVTFTYEQLQTEQKIRIQSESKTNDFTIESIVITRVPVSPPSTVAYSLADDDEIQNKSAGDTFEGTTWLQRAGEPTLTIGEKDGVKIISVTGRGEDWHCVDLKNLTSLPDGYEYTIKVTGTVTGATDDDKVKMKLSQTGSPYQTHDFHEVGEAGQYSLEVTFTYEQLQTEQKIRIQSESKTNDFTIESIVITRVPVSPPSTVAYSLADDDEIQNKSAGDTFEGTTWLQRAGEPTLTIGEKDGVKIISVTGRGEDWHCVDLKNLTSLPDGYEYTIKVTGTVTGATDDDKVKMKLSQTGSPYGTFIYQEVGADGNYSLEKTFTYTELQTEQMIRIQSESKTNDFTIESIVITQTPDPGGGTPPPDGKVIDDIFITFNDDDFAQWGTAFSIGSTSHAAIEWVSDFGKDEDQCSLKGAHLPESDDYTSYNNAIRLTFDEPLAKNAIYTISYSVYVPAEGNEGKDTLTGPGIVLNGDYAGATGVSKFPATPGTINIDEWKDVNVATPADGLNQTLNSIDFRFVVNDEKNHPDVWYIDNISIKQQLIDVGDTTPDYKDYPPLKDVYKDYFLIGTTSGNSRMSGDKLDIITYHFNAFTPENEMKPESVRNDERGFVFDTLDEQLAKIPGINLIGHTLAWHSQSPGWMWGTPDPLSKEDAKNNMDAHIDGVMNEYGAVLHSIDVVNEAFLDGRDNDDWTLNLRDTEGWYTALGWEWVEYAFLKAAQIADDNSWNCKLYYNDYNLDNAEKARSVYNMVKDINERYANTRPNGKPLIEGIGMQGHYNQNTIPANVEKSIELFSTLPGVSISITELDITYYPSSGGFTEQLAKSQAVKYAQLFDIFKRNAAGPANEGKGRIERVTFWGTNDADSWRGTGFPLLFDKNLRAKEAFKAVSDPEKYLGETGPSQDIPESKSFYGTPALGVNDPAWQKAAPIMVDKKPTNQSVNAGAAAVVKTLWDESCFYVRAEVTDPVLDNTSANAWEQDSVEIFLSETAHRTPPYADGDGQYRVSYEGRESFKSSGMGDGFSSFAAVTGNGYIVEMKIPFRVIEPKEGTVITFDVQINDVSGGASTRLLTVWSDLTANGYNTTELWGTLILSKPPVVTPTQPDTGGSGSPAIESSTPSGGVPPKNIGNKPVRGLMIFVSKEALDNAEKAFKQNPGIVQASPPITIAAPPETNKGLTPVSVPIPAGTNFTALVSPNGDGSFTPVPTYTDENGTVYALIDESKTLIPVTIKTDFNDVSEEHWFAESAKIASEMGIIFGHGDNTFRPDDTVTNQQTVAMLMRAIGCNADYAKVLQTAAEKGIKSASELINSGYTSRVTTAVLVKDVLASLNIDVSLEESEIAELLAPFNDLAGLSGEERLSIAVAVKYGILVGTYAGKDYSTMSPDTLLTRAQIATIAVRLVEFLTK